MGQFGQITHTHMYAVPFHTRKVFTTLRVNSPSFSGRTVPLFDSMLVHQGEGSGTPTEPHHTPSLEAQQSSPTAPSSPSLPPATTKTIPTVIPTNIPTLRQYSRRARIAQSSALPSAANEPAYPLRDDSQGEAFPTVSGLEAEQDRENIIKTSALPHDSSPRVTSLATDEGSMQHKLHELTDLCTRLQRQQTEMASKITAQDLEITSLKAKIKLLEEKDGGGAKPSGEDATIKGRSLETGEEAGVEKSMERGSNDTEELVNVLTSLDAASILTSGVQVVSVPPAAEVATMAREMEEQLAREDQRMNEQIARDAKIVRIYAEEELSLCKSTQVSVLAKKASLQEATKRILYVSSQKPLGMKHFKGMTLDEIREKFIPVWKQIEDFVPMASKEEGERFKRKGLRLEQDSAKKMKTSAEVSEEHVKEMMQLVPVEEVYVEALQVKHLIIDWEIYFERQRTYWKIIRLGGHTTVYQFFVDTLKHFDREDLTQLWTLVKEILSIRQATSDKEKELWVELKKLYEPDVEDQLWTHTQALMHDPVEWRLYDTCGVHHVLTKDQEIFIDEFPLPDYFPTACEDRFPLLSEKDALAEEVCTADEVKDSLSYKRSP
nr:hypothetical protein [Tanacetum cinerariifolium]